MAEYMPAEASTLVDTQEQKELDSDVVTITRHQLEYKVNPSCKLLRIGFTIEEVETALAG